VVPIITWIPWNPVERKKIEPVVLSNKEKGDKIYSVAWRIENNTPRIIVNNSDKIICVFRFLNETWWHHVTEAPEESKITVFINGTPNGLKGKICVGGHSTPSSISGDLLIWIKVQKKDKKNMISEVIKRIIPIFKPILT